MLKTWFVFFTICAFPILISYVLGKEDDSIFRNGQVDISKAFTTCSRGWFTFGEMCYKLGGRKKVGRFSWDEAQEACKEDFDGNLVTVYSQKIQDFLNTFMLLTAQSNVWIGLHDKVNESEFMWADGTQFNFSNFEPLEPSGFAKKEEDCVEMTFKSTRVNGKAGQWNDMRCSRENQFICQKPKGKPSSERVLDARYCTTKHGIGWRFEKSCFYVVMEKLHWAEAEKFCVGEYNGHLATIDYRVNEYLKYILQNVKEQLWIGIQIKEKPQQKWSSGWFVAFENWPEQEEYVDGTCVLRDKNGTWLIKSCNRRMWFLCEYSTATPPALKPTVENSYCPEEPAGWRDLGLDRCYYMNLKARVNWYEANFNCMRRGGTLASIHSKEEGDVLFEFVRYHPRLGLFIGLHRIMKNDKEKEEEEFVWADGSKLDFINWDAGEPNLPNEKCSEIMTGNMKWNDQLCTEKRGYICSVPKIIQYNSTSSKLQGPCENSISTPSLLGVIACVLVFSLLIGLVVYHFKLCDRGYARVKKLSGTKLQTLELDKKKRYRSEIIVTDDTNYEQVA